MFYVDVTCKIRRKFPITCFLIKTIWTRLISSSRLSFIYTTVEARPFVLYVNYFLQTYNSKTIVSVTQLVYSTNNNGHSVHGMMAIQ